MCFLVKKERYVYRFEFLSTCGFAPAFLCWAQSHVRFAKIRNSRITTSGYKVKIAEMPINFQAFYPLSENNLFCLSI